MDILLGYIVALMISIVWGYFSDLKKKQVGWFIGRIAFTLLFVTIFVSLRG